MKEKRITIVDIAKKLNVSIGLVSVVLSNKWKKSRISPQMAKKVKETAIEMGYKKNILARSLRTGKSGLVGLVVADISNSYFGKMARFIENEVSKLDYQILLASSDESAEKLESISDVFISRQVEAMIVVPVEDSTDVLEYIKGENIPLALIDRYDDDVDENYVMTDNSESSAELCNVLKQKGYKKTAAFVFKNRVSTNINRIKGYKQALEKDQEFINDQIFYFDSNNIQEQVQINIDQILLEGYDSLFIVNYSIGLEVLKYFNEKGIQIPQKLGVVAFDNIDFYQTYKPGITCIEQQFEEICKKTIDMLFIENDLKESMDKKKVFIPGKLLKRGSC